MLADRAYLDSLRADLESRGFGVETILGLGDPAREISRLAETEHVDLVAMATHGHRGVSDVIHGQTANYVRHKVRVPVLLLRAQSG